MNFHTYVAIPQKSCSSISSVFVTHAHTRLFKVPRTGLAKTIACVGNSLSPHDQQCADANLSDPTNNMFLAEQPWVFTCWAASNHAETCEISMFFFLARLSWQVPLASANHFFKISK